MATAASIEIALEAQTASLKKGMAEGKAAVDRLGSSMSGKVALGLAKFHAGLALVKGALASVRAGIDSVMMAMASIDETEKFAARIGVSANQLRILNFAAEQTGASVGTMQMGLQRMTRRIAEAATGSGEAVGALQELGLSAEYLAGLAPDKQFGAIADAMQNVSVQGDKVRLAMKLFDSEGVALVNTLAGGSAGLDEFGKQAEQAGFLLGGNTGAVEAANDAINRMKKAWGGLVQKIAILVAPALEKIANVLARIVGWFSKLFGVEGKASSVGGAAAEAMKRYIPPAEEAVEAVSEKVKTATLKATKSAKDAIDEIQRMETPGIGAVTRRSAAGFSAVQEAQRAAQDRERYHREMMAALREVTAAVRETSADEKVVRVLT